MILPCKLDKTYLQHIVSGVADAHKRFFQGGGSKGKPKGPSKEIIVKLHIMFPVIYLLNLTLLG